MNKLQMQIAAWRRGIADEIRFWDKWIETRGGQWADEFERRLRPDSTYLRRLVELAGSDAKILDVGAGPVSVLGRQLDGREIAVTACDPLGDTYNALLEKHGITPPVSTATATAEDLSSFFTPESFDVVFCRNALDHSFDPMRGLREMARVTKTDGWIVLEHFDNEACNENYGGFHQWNIELKDGRFHLWNREADYFVDEYLIGCHIEGSKTNEWNRFVIQKRAGSPPDYDDKRNRIAGMTSALIGLLSE